jgi:hypothetical protein
MNQTTVASTTPSFPTWKTVKVGMYKSVDEILGILKKRNFIIQNESWDQLTRPELWKLAETETEIELVRVTAADLGFTEEASRGAIYDRAREIGLETVTTEAGVMLRLDMPKHPDWNHEELLLEMAMKPMYVFPDGRHYSQFALHVWADVALVGFERIDGVAVYGVTYEDRFGIDSEWVFARRE